MLRIRTLAAIEVADPVERADAITFCQGSRYNRGCPGGKRLCRWFKGVWLCRFCWPHRRRIVDLAKGEKARKEVLSLSSRSANVRRLVRA
jgi:hypothetical protein